jgi:hypothetical protein
MIHFTKEEEFTGVKLSLSLHHLRILKANISIWSDIMQGQETGNMSLLECKFNWFRQCSRTIVIKTWAKWSVILICFGMKNTLKNNRYYIPKHARIHLSEQLLWGVYTEKKGNFLFSWIQLKLKRRSASCIFVLLYFFKIIFN